MENTERIECRLQHNDCRRLLERVARLYERYRTEDSKNFNIFTVLRAESDEVNLHSRFLAALLHHRKSRDAPLRNLEDFLCKVVGVQNFRLDGAEVKREYHDIDILILNTSSRQAIVLENKIQARDQERQLARYAERMEKDGYRQPHLLYLTLDGRDPKEGSAEGLEVQRVSYKDILPWLERCQERAHDNPWLRESIAQYVHLVRRLTGMDPYMKELRQLVLENDNLVLAHDLNDALSEAKIALLTKFWEEIDEAVQNRLPDLQKRTEESNTSCRDMRSFLSAQKSYYHGLYYGYDGIGTGASLAVEMHRKMYFGVRCHKKEHRDEYDRLEELMKDLSGNDGPTDWWPWWQCGPLNLKLKDPRREDLALLADAQARQEYAKEIADGLSKVATWISQNTNEDEG